jgi:hypothetical protein
LANDFSASELEKSPKRRLKAVYILVDTFGGGLIIKIATQKYGHVLKQEVSETSKLITFSGCFLPRRKSLQPLIAMDPTAVKIKIV